MNRGISTLLTITAVAFILLFIVLIIVEHGMYG